MARPEPLPVNVLAELAPQIGLRIPALVSPADWKGWNAQLVESLPVWTLPLAALGQQCNDLSLLAVHSGLWHHQVKLDGRPQVFARSTPDPTGGTNWKVAEVALSPLAESIDRAVVWVDENVKDDFPVRLLTILAFNMSAFWFLDGRSDQILVVHAPQYEEEVQSSKLLASAEFLDLLRRLTPMAGRIPHARAR